MSENQYVLSDAHMKTNANCSHAYAMYYVFFAIIYYYTER